MASERQDIYGLQRQEPSTDRGWADLDKRKKGGVAVYVRDSLKVLDVYRSNLYEFIALTVLLPSDHILLICGLYNPPKHSYQDIDLMNYIISFVDFVLNKHPEAAIVCGGDVNRLDMQEFKALSGWDFMYYFQNESECFIGVSKHRETNESTRPQAECFYCFEVFGYPDETRSTSFGNNFSRSLSNKS